MGNAQRYSMLPSIMKNLRAGLLQFLISSQVLSRDVVGRRVPSPPFGIGIQKRLARDFQPYLAQIPDPTPRDYGEGMYSMDILLVFVKTNLRQS